MLRRGVGGELVAAGLLGVVHREVGVDEHLLARQPVRGVEQRHPEARRHRARAPGRGRHRQRAHRVEHRGGDAVGLLGRRLGQQDRELVAAEAGEHVGLAQAAAQRVGDAHDQLVAGGVAERVVDRLEVVEVEHDRRALRPVALDVGDVALELALERAAVEQPGERVVVGHVAQLGLVAAALGDVLHLREEVQRHAVGVAHERRVDHHPDRAARRVQVAPLGAVARHLALEHRPARLPVGLEVVGVGDRGDRQALELGRACSP